jgi:hypothetical protein
LLGLNSMHVCFTKKNSMHLIGNGIHGQPHA